MLLHVIPAKAGIQCFHEVTNTLDPGFHRGDEYSAIFSHLPFDKGGGIVLLPFVKGGWEGFNGVILYVTIFTKWTTW